MKTSAFFIILSTLLSSTFARTDLSGCTRTAALLADGSGYTTFYWNPEVREQCSILDCGGGRAPPKTNVPGCPLYTGTDPVAVTGWPAEATPYELDAPQEPEAPAPTPTPEAPAPSTPAVEAPAASTPALELPAPAPSQVEESAAPLSGSGLLTITTSFSNPSSSASHSSSGSSSASDGANEPQESDVGAAMRSFINRGAVLVVTLTLFSTL